MGENENAPEFLESWTLAAIDMWINMGIIDVPAMILHHMDQEELINNGINPFNEIIIPSKQSIQFERSLMQQIFFGYSKNGCRI